MSSSVPNQASDSPGDAERLRAILSAATSSSALAALDTQLRASLTRGLDVSSLLPLPSSTFFSSVGLDLTKQFRSVFDEPAFREALQAPYRQMQETIAQSLSSLTSSFSQLYKPILADLAAVDHVFTFLSSSSVFEELRKELDRDKGTVAAFKAAGWPIAPSMSKELRSRVKELHSAGRVRYASAAIVAFYRKANCARLAPAVEAWSANPLFAPRIHILRDALDAHRSRRYTLSVPALLPQIEGILIDYVTANGIDAKLGSIKDVYEKVIGDPLDYDMSTWVVASTLLYQLQTNTYLFSDFRGEVRKSFKTRAVTRHTVLHGVATRYDTASNSLKTFLLLDALSVLKDVKNVGPA